MSNLLEKLIGLVNEFIKSNQEMQTFGVFKSILGTPRIDGYSHLIIKFFNEKNEELVYDSRILTAPIISTLSLLLQEIKINEKVNKGTFTIYPNGEYESSFIWDEAGHLGKLVRDVESWFGYVGIKAGERVEDKYPELCNIDFNFSMELILSFTNGVSNPALFTKKNQPELTFSLYMEQLVHYIENDYLEAFEEYAKIRKIDSEAVKKDTSYYLMMNEGELKGRYPRWNVARLTVGPQLGFLNFQDVKFEWREDLA